MDVVATNESYATGAGYLAYGCSVRGASHVRDGKPCQDAFAVVGDAEDVEDGTSVLLLAVADGHGDEKHDLSEHGSRLAVDAAIAELRDLVQHGAGSSADLIHVFRADFPRFLQRRWQEAVVADAETREIDVPRDGSERYELYRRYGTTLLVAAVVGETLLLGQLGDGDVTVVNTDGSVAAPLLRSAELVGNLTYSLSSSEASRLWVTAPVSQTDAAFLLLATDGLSNSFVDDAAFRTFARSLRDRVVTYSVEAVAHEMPEWLQGYSKDGSGDDITVVFAATQPAIGQIHEDDGEHAESTLVTAENTTLSETCHSESSMPRAAFAK